MDGLEDVIVTAMSAFLVFACQHILDKTGMMAHDGGTAWNRRRHKAMRLSRKIGFAGLAGALALAIAGCGGTAVGHTPKPAPRSSAKPPASSGLTLAEASSPSHQVQFPVVPCNTQGSYGQAWESSGLLAGSPIAECPTVNTLAQQVPAIVPVTNLDPNMSNAQAEANAKALLATMYWDNWDGNAVAPQVQVALGEGAGADAPYLQMLLAGDKGVGGTSGQSVFPDHIWVEALNSSSASGVMANPSATFAIVVTYVQRPYTYEYQSPGQRVQTTTSSPLPTAIYDGSVVSTPELGAYFKVATYTLNCTVGVAAGICGSAVGAS